MKMTMNFKTWCIQNQCFDLLRYYELADNELDSENIAWATAKWVSFHCDVCNLTWKMQMNHATRRPRITSCPYCTHRKVSPFYNFEILLPELSKYVDLEMNQISPDKMFPNYKKVIYWKCKYGHEWETSIAKRTSRGSDCPYCSLRLASPTYSLAVNFPEIAKEWNFEKNGSLKPTMVTPKSGKKVW